MEDGNSLDDILNDTADNEPVTEEPVNDVPADEPEAGPVRDEHGRFAPKGETGAPPAPVKEEPALDHAAIVAERRRRQEAEQRAAALEEQIKAFQNPPAPQPDFWEDAEAALQHNRNQAVSEASFNAKLDMSEMLASQAHEDFDEMKAKFVEMMQLNPALQQQALAARHPWEHAYQAAKNAARIEEIGATDIDTLKAKLREELMQEMQAQQPARPGIPPSLTTERNVGARTGPAWAGPRSLSELLG